MKNLFLLSFLFFGLIACYQPKIVQEEPVNADSEVYDSLLAAEVGADNHGMRRYVMALLKEGLNRDQDSTEAAQLQWLTWITLHEWQRKASL